jgi:queuine tRNA-ribosyltransferase
MFKILKKDKKTKARLGVLSTPHGDIQTPSYVIVATHAQIKCLEPEDIKGTKTQIVIADAFHLWEKALQRASLQRKDALCSVAQRLGVEIPSMTDSGGFQVFSLGFGMKDKVGKILKINSPRKAKRQNIKITDKGVYFTWDGREKFLSPEISMDIQQKLGADIIFAFDECTSPLDNYVYNNKALGRTHKWAKICLNIFSRPTRSGKTESGQMLFGIVQGGKYKSLRQKSAKFIGKLPFDGFGIGGSFGKDEMVKTLKWIVPHLPEERPRHLLGVGKIIDIFNAVENGMDLFDCVIPTREARHGKLYGAIGSQCNCPACRKGLTKNKLKDLFKTDKPLAQRHATIHNVWFFNDLLEKIRESIKNNKYPLFRRRFLRNDVDIKNL